MSGPGHDDLMAVRAAGAEQRSRYRQEVGLADAHRFRDKVEADLGLEAGVLSEPEDGDGEALRAACLAHPDPDRTPPEIPPSVQAELRAEAHPNELVRAVAEDVGRLAALIAPRVTTGHTLFLCGTGGSAADAQHLAAEYVAHEHPLPALALTTDTSVLTAALNDLGADQVFSCQILALGKEKTKLALAIRCKPIWKPDALWN